MLKKKTKREAKAKKVKEIKKTEGKDNMDKSEDKFQKNAVVTFQRKILDAVLSVAKDFIERKSSMPVLVHVHIKAEKGDCRITVTNLETSWTTVIQYKGDSVSRCVPLELLISEVKALHPEIEEVELRFTESTVRVNGRCEIFTMKGEEFPAWKEIEKPLAIKVEELVQKTKKVIVASGESDTRYTLNSVLLDLENGHVVATDGHRLHIEDIKKTEKSGKYVIPRKAAFLAIKHQAEEEIMVGDKHIIFKVAGGKMLTRLIDGNYPDYQNVIPKENPVRATFMASEFLRVLKGAVPVSSEGKGIRLTINGQMDIESTNPGLGSYKWHVPCTSEGIDGNFMIAFNANYIIDAVKTYTTKEEDTVVMEMSDSLRPCLINGKAVVMPMRI